MSAELVISQESLATLTEIIEQSMAAAGLDRDDDPKQLPQRVEELRFAGALHIARDFPRKGNAETLKAEKLKAPTTANNGHGYPNAEPSAVGRTHRRGSPSVKRICRQVAAPI